MNTILYKPSYMVPNKTSGTSTGVIDATSTQTFIAQLHASSPIDAYQLLIRENTAQNTIAYSSGIVVLDTPFVPTDDKGKYIPLSIDVPASHAALSISSTNTAPDNDIVYIDMNVDINLGQQSFVDNIALSTNGGTTWTGTSANPIISVTCSSKTVKITFDHALVGDKNKIRFPVGSIVPINDYYSIPTTPIVSDEFSGIKTYSLIAIDLSSAHVSTTTSFTAKIVNNTKDYAINRAAQINILSSSGANVASRTQSDYNISYTIMDDMIYFYVGAYIEPDEYTVSYTDPTCTGTNTVSATFTVVAHDRSISYKSYTVDDDRYVVALNMNQETNSEDPISDVIRNIYLSTDGGQTWNGKSTNPIVTIGFTNAQDTPGTSDSYNMRIEFSQPLSGNVVIKILANTIVSRDSFDQIITNTEMLTPIIRLDDIEETPSSPEDIDTFAAVDNICVNGFSNGYKWMLRLWNGVDLSDPSLGMVESYEACFDTEDKPTLSVTGEENISRRYATWTGTYNQLQNIPCMWYRWRLYTNNEVVKDTGAIYTSHVPPFTYSGLLSDHIYVAELSGLTQSGVSISATFESSVSYSQFNVPGTVSVEAMPDGALSIICKQADYIIGEANGDISFLDNTPVTRHTSVHTGSNSSISFRSTSDFGVDFSSGDTIIARIHSDRDGVLLSYTSEDGTFNCQLIHEGLVKGLSPNTTLYPSNELYPLDQKYGQFRYVVNGEDVDIIQTPYYSKHWYTVFLTYDTCVVYAQRV